MNLKEGLIFAVGVAVLYLMHLMNCWRKKSKQRPNVSCDPRNTIPADRTVVTDWGYACNQLCLELYGVDHPSALLVKPTDFWQQEFMYLLRQTAPADAAALLRRLDREEAAWQSSRPLSDSCYAENTCSARQMIRRYLQQI